MDWDSRQVSFQAGGASTSRTPKRAARALWPAGDAQALRTVASEPFQKPPVPSPCGITVAPFGPHPMVWLLHVRRVCLCRSMCPCQAFQALNHAPPQRAVFGR